MALVTGAARGRGRSHALRLAREGADVMLVDLCDNIPSCDYPLATSEDLDCTASMIEKLGRRAAVYRCDVCDRAEMEIAVDTAVRQLGALHIVVANAAIVPTQPDAPIAAFIDTFDVDFLGVVNTFSAAMPRLGEGASLIASGPPSSTQGPLRDQPQGPGGAAYELAQSMVSQYVQMLAKQLAPHGIRVNTASGSANGNDFGHAGRLYRPVMLDVDRRGDRAGAASLTTVSWPVTTWADTDASAAVAFLAADESRAITGRHVTVDAGSSLN
ncbi:SDR family oxidoreductase [Mycobacterium parmense]|uniref:SDR family oxidoreductase n=1 Tax=Mycobacterium parmense TaxID=185642 RepID=UPI000A14F053|nr:SDR family oxidoreductase [Mycobacterium parmense]MCV7352215.1 SDR family oxidoreductase [Mycobacterium parmense]